MTNFRPHRPVRIGRTTNRKLGFHTPSPSDSKCPFFHDRFIRHGVAVKENRAICDKKDDDIVCDYRRVLEEGTPLCLRYWYGPKYEIIDEIQQPLVQKTNSIGRPLFKQANGSEGTEVTSSPIMVSVSKENPIPYITASEYHEQDALGNYLYWDLSVTPAVKTTTDTGTPVMLYAEREFYSKQYEDTHEKLFGTNGNRLGWHHDV